VSRTPIIKTPETDPNHEFIGQTFRGPFGEHLYFCDSWQEGLGFWMTRVDAPEENKADQFGQWRKNVSMMAIGKTFHVVHKPYTAPAKVTEASPQP
jgi:hypothetical protein